VFTLARTRLPAALEAKLATFPSAIIETHGKDLTVSAEPSRAATPSTTTAPTPVIPVASSSSAPPKLKAPEVKNVNTTTVEVQADFQASAADLFSLLTDEKRIPAWTRAPAKVETLLCEMIAVSDMPFIKLQSQPQPGSEYSLFGGGVKGKYISLKPEKEIVQTWALQSPTWPAGKCYPQLWISFCK
jgi:activator of HSP90 ATPase